MSTRHKPKFLYRSARRQDDYELTLAELSAERKTVSRTTKNDYSFDYRTTMFPKQWRKLRGLPPRPRIFDAQYFALIIFWIIFTLL